MTDKLDGIKPGDRVRVTFEGVVDVHPGFPFTVLANGGDGQPSSFNPEEIKADTFQITRIEPELAVGDMVTWGSGVMAYEIVAIRDGVSVLYSGGIPQAMPLKLLTRVPAK